MILTRRELDTKKCTTPGCTDHRVELHQPCHPETGHILVYDPDSGTLILLCAECKARGPSLLIAEHALT